MPITSGMPFLPTLAVAAVGVIRHRVRVCWVETLINLSLTALRPDLRFPVGGSRSATPQYIQIALLGGRGSRTTRLKVFLVAAPYALNCVKKPIGRRPRRARVYERRRRRNRAEARERGARAKIRRACQSERVKRLSQVSARNRVLPPPWSRASVLKANWDVLPRTSTPDFDAKIPIQWAASPPRSLQPVCYIASDLTLRMLMLLLDLLHAHRASNATPRTSPST